MKAILNKFGKITNFLKRTGFINGLRLVLVYLGRYVKSFWVGSGDVLYVTEGVGDIGARCRVFAPAEELRLHGFKVGITILDNPFLDRYVDRFQVFIFYRLFMTPSLHKMIEKIKAQGKEIIYDTDDLVFDPRFLKYMAYFEKLTAIEKRIYEKGIGSDIIYDSYIKKCSAPTNYLLNVFKEKGKETLMLHNKLSRKDVAISDKLLSQPQEKRNEVRIGYISGTISHNKDFATITPALMEILSKYKNVKLMIVGMLDLESELNKFSSQIGQLRYVPRNKVFNQLMNIDINLAPLEVNNPYCEAKSELKFIESGIMKVPTVAVRNQTFSEAITDGVNGFLAENTEEWIEKIGKLVADENLRKSMGEKARERVLADYSNPHSHEEEYYDYIRKAIKRVS